MIPGRLAPLGVLLVLPGCAAMIVHREPSLRRPFAASLADLRFAVTPIRWVADDPGLVGSLWLTPICMALGLADLPLSFVVDVAVRVPDLLRPVTQLPRGLGREQDEDDR